MDKVYNAAHPLLALVRSNHLLIRQLFGVSVPRRIRVSFDPTTIALRRAVCDAITPEDQRIFEMGIGQAALVGLAVAKQYGINIDGADCSADRVQSSILVADANAIKARFLVSDLFASVPSENRYDIIFFNVPYVPSERGRSLQLTKRLGVDGDQVWDGGSDGTQVLREFLSQAKSFLSERGRVVFGVQHIFVPDELVTQVIEDCGYTLVSRNQKRFVPSCCYIVRPSLDEAPKTAIV